MEVLMRHVSKAGDFSTVGFRRQFRGFAYLSVVFTMIALAGKTQAYPTGNLLTNPGFETNSLTPLTNVLGPPYLTNIWGDEASTITGPVGGVNPNSGSQMLSMTTDGLVATQTLEVVDVSAYATDINAGAVTADFSALFDVDKNVPAGAAAVYLTFWDSSNNYVGPTNIGAALTLDFNPATWEQISLTSIPVPIGTNYLLAQVAYNNASMTVNGVDQPGFVDDAVLTLDSVPEPASLGLGAFSAIGLLRIRRRK
jgi:PEP-CTERM motif